MTRSLRTAGAVYLSTGHKDFANRVPKNRVDGLDLLRGIAVALVIVHHGLPTPFSGSGVVGVVMFFALSGYLITGLLAAELRRTSRIDFKRFYLRRVRRLAPALVAMLIGFAVITIVFNPIGDLARLPKTILVGLTWTGDLPFGHASAATFHLWTLALEEQFYLFWPAVLAFAWRRGKVNAALIGVGAVCLLACGAVLHKLSAAPDDAYSLPTSWAVCFAIGAAVGLHRDKIKLPGWLTWVSLAGLAVLSIVPVRGHIWTYLVAGPLIAGFTGVLLLALREWRTIEGALLRPVVWLGTVSYGAYLWNYPITIWLRPHLGVFGGGLVAIILTVAMAALSWKFVEARFQNSRARLPYRLL